MNKQTIQLFTSADIMIPKSNTDMTKWSVVACDQYTSEHDYWSAVNDYVGDAPSTLHMVFPEIYLEDNGFHERIQSISTSMKQYLSENIFDTYENAYIYVKRTLSNKQVRNGIIGKIDLEYYDYHKGSTLPIRATEGTVLERIPPRVKVRQECPLESPHIMILIDDKNCEIIEHIASKANVLEKIYDFDFMQDSGHIAGYLLNEESVDILTHGIENLAHDDDAFKSTDLDHLLLFAVGDGNHSLATAKTCYENLKLQMGDEALDSKARYALVELVNLHDKSLEFESIHRVLFDVDVAHVRSQLDKVFRPLKNSTTATLAEHDFAIITSDAQFLYDIPQPTCNLAVGDVQNFIDSYIEEFGGRVDYIHGEDVVRTLCQQEQTIGILLNCMDKTDLYKTIRIDGTLPRKTFSMGEACDKRFYLEMREIL